MLLSVRCHTWIIHWNQEGSFIQNAARGLRYFSSLGLNWAALIGVQFVPALSAQLGSATSPDVVLLITVLVVSVQAGQAVGMQHHILKPPEWMLVKYAYGIAFACAVILVAAGPFSGAFAVAAVLGSCLGYVSVARIMHLLKPGSRTRFQLALGIRNLLWLLIVTLLTVAGFLSYSTVIVGSIGVWIVAAFLEKRWIAEPQAVQRAPWHGVAASVILGIGASLLYRNDVSLLRSQFLEEPQFFLLHYCLLGYSFAVAVVGVGVSQILYPRLRVTTPYKLGVGRAPLVLAPLMITSSLLLLLVYVLPLSGSYVLVIGLVCCLAVASVNPVVSAFLHYYQSSHAVYAIGIISILILWTSLQLGIAPLIGFYLYNALTSAALLFALLRREARLKGSDIARSIP